MVVTRCTFVKFPYTTRQEMLELEAGSIHCFRLRNDGVIHSRRCMWEPKEPERWLTPRQARKKLKRALQTAAEDITRGADRVAVTLSGGLDSRVVLACVQSHKPTTAITLADHENLTLRIAREISQVAGVEHRAVFRDPHYYAHVLLKESALIGLEHASPSVHTACLFDDDSDINFDLLVGGFGSDTLLKGMFKSLDFSTLLQRPCKLPDLLPEYPCQPYMLHLFKDDVIQQMEERFRCYIASLRKIRPTSAVEWSFLYPSGRTYGGGYTLANSRWFASDELFLHRDVIDVSVNTPFMLKKLTRLTQPVFADLAGPLYDVTNSNNGMPARASILSRGVGRIKRKLRKGSTSCSRESSIKQYPWFDDGSWIDYRVFQRESKAWRNVMHQAADRVQGSHVLDELFKKPVREILASYTSNNPYFNYGLVQLVLSL